MTVRTVEALRSLALRLLLRMQLGMMVIVVVVMMIGELAPLPSTDRGGRRGDRATGIQGPG